MSDDRSTFNVFMDITSKYKNNNTCPLDGNHHRITIKGNKRKYTQKMEKLPALRRWSCIMCRNVNSKYVDDCELCGFERIKHNNSDLNDNVNDTINITEKSENNVHILPLTLKNVAWLAKQTPPKTVQDIEAIIVAHMKV